jgi:hypothetical protein
MSPDPKLAEPIARATAARYGALSTSKASLSCGRALDVAGPREGEDVVDLGCGRGDDVARAAERVGPGGTDAAGGADDVVAPAAAQVDDVLPVARLARVERAAAGEGLARRRERPVARRGGARDVKGELRVRAHRG